MKYANPVKTAGVILLALLALSCQDWLNLYPENAQTTDQYWQTREDVEAVVAAGYIKLRSAVDKLFVWGEIRGNGIDIVRTTADNDIKAAEKLRDMDILPTNSYAKWDQMYQVVNMANSVLKYAPGVMERDASFTQSQMASLQAEALFLRALAYFYLVRTFGEVPLILEPYVNDEQKFEIAKSAAETILSQVTGDLTEALRSAKEFFPEIDNDNPAYSKGRATKWAIHALLADIALWQGRYDDCIASCDAILNSGRVGLISGALWFTNFYPGNSNESIFEIQYDYDLGQTNAFIRWFNTDNKYSYSQVTFGLFEDTKAYGDVRGDGASITTKNYRAWKYLGLYPDVTATAQRSTSTQNDQNFIVYRLADIYLMKAEALAMQGLFGEATEWVARVRNRAGIQELLTPPSSELDMLDLILDERGRELFAEGKRWFDLLRVARRNDYRYMDYFINEVITVISLNKVAIVASKLKDPNSHYLPIHQEELNANPLLVQNPYYANLGN